MKNIWVVLLLTANVVNAQTFIAKATGGEDETLSIQTAFNNPTTKTVVINTQGIIINGTLTIPAGKTLKIEQGTMLTGKGTINGGSIDAAYQSQIFDTTLTVNPKSVNQFFSVKWFGAKGNNSDDYVAIQKSINTCISNNIRTVYFPVGRYKISKPLIIRGAALPNMNNDNRAFCTVELLGESSFWDANTGSEILAGFNNSFAVGIQDGKGCKIRKLKIDGLFKPPYGRSLKFYNTSFENFTDGKCRDSRYSPYAAIVIDPFTNLRTDKIPADGGYPALLDYYGKANGLQTQSGSTGTELEELNIDGFVTGICSSPNGLTRNAEITLINKVHFNNCKLCISGGQDQEKENTVSNIYCWGGTHTIFATAAYGSPRMAGNWNINHVNIAGGVVRFIDNDQHGYFPTYISNVFAESLGSFGTLNSELACEVADCSIDFAYQKEAGQQTLLHANGANVVFRSCNFRYYGEKTPLLMESNCVFDHCYFSGPVIKNKDGSFNNFFPNNIFSRDKFWFLLIPVILIAFAIAIIYYYRKKVYWKVFYRDSQRIYTSKKENLIMRR